DACLRPRRVHVHHPQEHHKARQAQRSGAGHRQREAAPARRGRGEAAPGRRPRQQEGGPEVIRRLLPLALLALSGLLSGCAGTLVRAELTGVKKRIETARENGAYLCAPKELAMAEAHYDFAAAELNYGSNYPAKEHADIAAKNANLAVERSPRKYCTYSE